VTLPEAATLAALPKAPSYYTPRRSANRALNRRNLVLDLMVREGYVSEDRLPDLKETRIRIHGEGWYPDQSGDSYALDAVRAIADSVIKGTRLDLSELTVYTSLDARAQRAADAAVRRRAASIGRTVEGAMVAIDPTNGDIRALSGGRRFKRGTFNRALYAKRQPGSAFKPFVYAAALGAGYGTATEVDDEPITVRMQGRVWEPKNYDGNYLGRTTFRQALIHSANAATVRVSQVVGEQRIIETAHKNGITAELQPIPSIALGALEVTPLELVVAYAPFANGGFRVKPRLVRRIESGDGNILFTQEEEREQVMDPRDAYQMTSMLRGVIDFGTGRALRTQGVRGMVAGKTGTTNNASDVWFIGYTPTIVAGFWFGFDEPRSMGSSAAGGRLAAPAWAEWYRGGWRESATTDASWDPPDGMIMRVIDPTTGYLANQWCPSRQSEWFEPGTEPAAECPQHAEPIPEWEDDEMEGWEEVPEVIDSMGRSLGRRLRRIFRW
jgi:membrane carboxypeptidase/penicillin-binding protein